MSNDAISIDQIYALIQRNIKTCVGCAVIGLLSALLLTQYLPARYKAKAVLSIDHSYFKNPLISDLLADASNEKEISAQREGLLRLAVDEAFVSRLGSEFGLFKYSADDLRQLGERAALRKRIEIFPINATSFQVSVVAARARDAYRMTNLVLEKMAETLAEQRKERLLSTKIAVESQLSSLSSLLIGETSQRKAIETKLREIESDVLKSSGMYSETHPTVLKLQREARALQRRLDELRPSDDKTMAAYAANTTKSLSEMYEEIVRKLTNLNIVFQMEESRGSRSYFTTIEEPSLPSSPVFPNPIVFAFCGMLGGAGIGLLLAFQSEMKRASLLTPYQAAEMLGIRYLGDIHRMSRLTMRSIKTTAADCEVLPAVAKST